MSGKKSVLVLPIFSTIATASAVAFNPLLWLIFDPGKIKRVGIKCPVAFIRNN